MASFAACVDLGILGATNGVTPRAAGLGGESEAAHRPRGRLAPGDPEQLR